MNAEKLIHEYGLMSKDQQTEFDTRYRGLVSFRRHMNSLLRETMAANGAKGGSKGKGNPRRAELMRKAANARWAKVREAKTNTQPKP